MAIADSQAASGARPRKPRFAVEVKAVRRLTPRMVSVTFAGEALAGFTSPGPASHVKLIFDSARGATPTSQIARPIMRTYTPRRFDPAARELDIEFVIHGEGPASQWAEHVAVGQSLTIAGPGRSYAVDPQARWYVLAGDTTAIPAIETILEALPAGMRALVLLEVPDAGEERPIRSKAPTTEVRWLTDPVEGARPGHTLEAAVRATELPSGQGCIYVACEADAMRRIRRHLLTERQFPRERLVTRGYWRLGETDHPDRDYGEDVA